MNQKTCLNIIATCVAFGLTACGEPAPSDDAAAPAAGTMPTMPGMQNAAQSVVHSAEGTINSIDQAAGTVNISHGPVASASWPAMTMSFKLANPASVTELSPGERVQFRFTIESGMNATVTEITRAQ
jgi:Cu(I)/Ag(I) efflux system membrane fusion protein